MVVTVSPTDPRSVRALAVFATADRWVKGHRKSDGRAFFTIPGSNGRLYHADTRDCSCPDARERGVTCKHQLAVRLWNLKNDLATTPAATAQPAPAPKPAPACRACGGPLPAGTVSGVCNEDACFDGDVFAGVLGIKAAFGSRSACALSGPVVQLVGAA